MIALTLPGGTERASWRRLMKRRLSRCASRDRTSPGVMQQALPIAAPVAWVRPGRSVRMSVWGLAEGGHELILPAGDRNRSTTHPAAQAAA